MNKSIKKKGDVAQSPILIHCVFQIFCLILLPQMTKIHALPMMITLNFKSWIQKREPGRARRCAMTMNLMMDSVSSFLILVISRCLVQILHLIHGWDCTRLTSLIVNFLIYLLVLESRTPANSKSKHYLIEQDSTSFILM